MHDGKQIKIIKREQRRNLQQVGSSQRNGSEEPKRDVVAVVTEWVRELRRKKAEESTHGFERLPGGAS
jgi:hypothetical protein